MESVAVLGLMLQILVFMMREFVCSNTGAPPHQLVSCLESDKEALLDFKSGLEDPQNWLFSWKGNNCCQWEGISCDNRTGAVIEIDLHCSDQDYYSRLGGKISPSITKLKSLRHLDLSNCSFDGIPIPDFFGSLDNLQYLNLSYAGFYGAIPPNLGNLSSLQYLDLSSQLYCARVVINFEWVAGLVSLKRLDMSEVNLSLVRLDWIRILSRLPFLTELHLSSCSLSGPFPSHAFLNFTSLAVLDLHSNNFNSTIPDSLVNVSSLVDVDISHNSLCGSIPLGLGDLPSLKSLSLSGNENLTANCSQLFGRKWEKIQFLDLSSNELHGKLPTSIGNMKFLTHLGLSGNNVEGGIPSSIGKLCNLEYVDISSNKLDGTLQGAHSCLSRLRFLDLSKNQLVGKLPEWLGQLQSLTYLDLSFNSLYGPIPVSLGSLQNLVQLYLGSNRLNGTLPDSLGNLSQLSTFDVFSNQLTGLVTERHFQKLGKLTLLNFSSNPFTLNISSNWVPPFQLVHLKMGSCHIGPSFPAWLKFQKKVDSLDISNAGIFGNVPRWFWEISSKMSYLNISFNKLEGQLPISFDQEYVDLSSNLFEGPIPCPTDTTLLLDLSNNKFSGPIPSNIGNFDFLIIVIDLSKNNLSGKIPLSLGRLRHLQILHMSDNNLSGEIPETFSDLSSLETLDLGNNRLTGKIPQWIREGFESLEILNLRSNSFSGGLPSSLSSLSSLRILDVTGNQLNGSIPVCFGEFKAMTKVQREIKSTNDGRFIIPGTGCGQYARVCHASPVEYVNYYKDKLAVSMKGQFLTFTKALSLVVSLDLSGNSLSGEFPPEMTKLLGLVVLNLSGNHISGVIPESISNLKELQSLDFSSNRLSGPIPQSLQSLDFLQYLNLSNNDFSGKIPYKDHMTTFEAPSFAGNPRLCGPPLVVTCPGDDKDGNSSKGWTSIGHHHSFVDNWFPLSVGLGFAAGLLVPFLVIAITKSWGDAYFGLVNKVFERIALFTYRMRRATP